MAYYANQKTIEINRELPKKGDRFIMIRNENFWAAMRELSAVGFTLWCYLCANEDGYEKDYSPRDLANLSGISYESARKATKQLEEKGYLVKAGGNRYKFYETPNFTPVLTIREEYREIVDNTGKTFVLTYRDFYNQLKDYYFEEDIKRQWNTYKIVEVNNEQQ